MFVTIEEQPVSSQNLLVFEKKIIYAFFFICRVVVSTISCASAFFEQTFNSFPIHAVISVDLLVIISK